ncbi:MAG: hypothetical protein HC843_07940 [Sphingomonadales bacterium]|nr:hypothetical protein [Sphingomonadales bacterium]
MTVADTVAAPLIIFATLGTKGDAIPFIALAEEMQDRGFRTQIISNSDHQPLAENGRIEFHAICDPEMDQIGCDLQEFTAQQLIPAAYRTAEHIGEMASQNPNILVVSRFGTWGAAAACEKYDIGLINILLQPDAIWEEGNPIDSEDLLLLNKFRHEQALPAIQGKGVHEAALTKIALFPHWFGYPESLSSAAGECTAFPVQRTQDKGLPSDLDEFISRFGPPIIFGLSTGIKDATKFEIIARGVAQKSKRPVVFLSAAYAGAPHQGDDNFFGLSYADHACLFSRSAMVIHNGGIGVTVQAMRAGIAQMVIPYVWDQPENAARVKALGIGHIVEPENLSVDIILPVIRLLDHINPKLLLLAQKAACQGDGIIMAADIIERYCKTACPTRT